ncbi:thioredoxin domain-containing protein [Bradyrhizobium sp. USDA 4454]
MKFQPARYDVGPCPSEVESISAHARLVMHASPSAPEVLLKVDAVYSLRAVHVALSLPELIKALRRCVRGAVPAHALAGKLVGRLGPRRRSTLIWCHRHDTLGLIGRRLVRLVKIDRIVAPIVWLYGGSVCAGNASR